MKELSRPDGGKERGGKRLEEQAKSDCKALFRERLRVQSELTPSK